MVEASAVSPEGRISDQDLGIWSADLIFIGREFLRDPYFPKTAAQELRTSIESLRQYDRTW